MNHKNNLFYKAHKRVKEGISARKKVLLWKLKGRPVPPPHAVKQAIVREYEAKFKLPVFIETGRQSHRIGKIKPHDSDGALGE